MTAEESRYVAMLEKIARRSAPVHDADDPAWHVVYIGGSGEKVTTELLRRHGFTSYYPKFRKMVPPPRDRLSKAQRKNLHHLMRPVVKPLFPGYLFVHFDMGTELWHSVFRFAGVYGMVCADDLPVRVPDELVKRLMALEVDGAIPLQTPVAALPFKAGDSVRVTDGPFASFPGMIEELDESRGRALIDVMIFGRATPVDLEFDQIEKV